MKARIVHCCLIHFYAEVRALQLANEHGFRNHRLHLGNVGGVYQADSDGPRLRPNTTPIIMAAHRNNFYIVQLLLMRGATVSRQANDFLTGN